MLSLIALKPLIWPNLQSGVSRSVGGWAW